MSEQAWRIRHIDLAQGPCEIPASDSGVFLTVWWRNLPLGSRALLPAETPFRREQMLNFGASLAADQLAARGHGLETFPKAGVDGIPQRALSLREAAKATRLLEDLDDLAQPTEPRVADNLSLIVCTRDRLAMLEQCLASLAAQSSPPGQIVVVDNSGDGNARSLCADRSGVTYIHEPRPGLSVARNAGLAVARGEFIAFTDDDVVLHDDWCGEILRAFATGADAVTGLVLPASLDTEAQRAFELNLGGFTQRFQPLVFDRSFLDATHRMGPQVWRIGAGANMAFRRASIAPLGGFDERLGAGASGCSEDSEFWYRILAAGGVCLYEPRAVVFHHHRRDWAGLRKQYRAYMRGHVAALVAQADRYGARGNLRRIVKQLPAYFVRTALVSIQTLAGWRLRLLAEEVIGWSLGLAYLARPGWRRRGARPATGGAALQGQASHA
jgi:glycosyltransferase involved in cell wall biosynthesis